MLRRATSHGLLKHRAVPPLRGTSMHELKVRSLCLFQTLGALGASRVQPRGLVLLSAQSEQPGDKCTSSPGVHLSQPGAITRIYVERFGFKVTKKKKKTPQKKTWFQFQMGAAMLSPTRQAPCADINRPTMSCVIPQYAVSPMEASV